MVSAAEEAFAAAPGQRGKPVMRGFRLRLDFELEPLARLTLPLA
jgi:hypothetical protein